MVTIANIAKQSNLALAYTRLLTNPEGTYKNFFRDTYSIYGMASEKNIALLQKRVKAGYLPTQSIRVFMPKANGLNRMYTLLSIEDQIVYQAYAIYWLSRYRLSRRLQNDIRRACLEIFAPHRKVNSFINAGRIPIKHIRKQS